MNLTKLHGDGRGGNKSAVTPLIGAEIASNWRADASSASLYRETLYGRLWWSIRSFQPLPMDRVPCETTCVSFHRKEEVVEREVEIVNKMLTIQLPPRQPPSDEKFPSCRFSESVLSRRGLHHVAGYNSLSSSYLERGVERERGFLSLSGSSTIFPDSSRSIITSSPFLLARRSKTRSRRTWFLLVRVPPTRRKSRFQTRLLGDTRDSFQSSTFFFQIDEERFSRKSTVKG